MGPLGCLARLLTVTDLEQNDSVLQIRIAAMQAISALAPILLQQSVGLSRRDLLFEFNYNSWLGRESLDMNMVRYASAKQAFLLARYLGPRLTDHPKHVDLCRGALTVVLTYLVETPMQDRSAALAISQCGRDLIPLLESPGVLGSQSTMLGIALVSIARHRFRPNTCICNTMLSPRCFPPLIWMIGQTTLHTPTGIQEMLQSMVGRMQNNTAEFHRQSGTPQTDDPCIRYLEQFTQIRDGFFALTCAGQQEIYIEQVVDASAEITSLAASVDSTLGVDHIELRVLAVPAFLEVVSMVINHWRGVPAKRESVVKFSQDTIELLSVASTDALSRRFISRHSACHTLRDTLRENEDVGRANELYDRIGELMDNLGITYDGMFHF
jgi:hypothetical protein